MKRAILIQRILGMALITQLILVIPLLAMLFTDEVNWSPTDFALMGVLLFSAGLAFILITRSEGRLIQRAAFGLAIGITLLMCWVNLAVGLIGSGPNIANLLYIGVLAVEIIAAVRIRFRANDMERVMYYTALALGIVAIIALIGSVYGFVETSVIEIISVNAFFATLFVGAGMLFRYGAKQQSPPVTT